MWYWSLHKVLTNIMQLTITNEFPIKISPLKYLTEVMLHWHLYITVIWYCWFPRPCEFIMRIHHRWLDCYERTLRRHFWKIFQSLFVGFFHCDTPFPFLYYQFQWLFEIPLCSRIILFYTYMKNLRIKLVLLHCNYLVIRKCNTLIRLIFNFSSFLPFHGHKFISVTVKLFLIFNDTK